ncbi:hypothetical protein K3495_g12550 [Podosphaera aphanis]|nr:hypothetical protein K3495_g12550 [Podosphaera aphanis]
MRHDTPRQPKTASFLSKPSQNSPSRPPVPISKQPQSWAAPAAAPPAINLPANAPSLAPPNAKHRPFYTPAPKQVASTTGPKAIFRLPEKHSSVHTQLHSNGLNVTFLSDTSRKLALDNDDSIKASLSGSLIQLEDRFGHVVKRIPRTIWNPVSNVVPTTLDHVRSIAKAQTGVAPSGAHWSLHEDCHDPLHTAVIYFPKEVPIFRMVDSAPSRRYIPNPKVVKSDAYFGFHPSSRCRTQALCTLCGALRHRGECCHQRRCINYLGPQSANDHKCPLRPHPFKGKLINPSENRIAELRSRNRSNLRKERRAEAAAAAATITSTSDGGSSAPTFFLRPPPPLLNVHLQPTKSSSRH